MTSPEPARFLIEPPDADKRLDHFLKERFPDASRGTLQRHIEAGKVLVHGKPRTPHYPLHAGEEIVVEPLRTIDQILQPAERPDVRTVWEDDAIAVVEKPSGLLTHPIESREEPTLVHHLLARYPAIRSVGEDPLRPGIVHRLDRDVSGLLLVAKTPEAFATLKEQFQRQEIQKEYAAIVYGAFAQPRGTITLAIGRSKGHRAKMAGRPPGSQGRAAITHYEVLAATPDYSFLAVRPKTGRMHQIRVHLSAVGHPIVGDSLYRRRDLPGKKVSRMLLHARRIGFRDRAGTWQEVESFLPKEFEDFLAAKFKEAYRLERGVDKGQNPS